MWASLGLKFIVMSATTPWGITVVFAAISISCLSRVFAYNRLLKNLYMILSIVSLLYLVVIGTMDDSPAIASTGDGAFAAVLFSMFLGVPFSVGWLLGWPIGALLQAWAPGQS